MMATNMSIEERHPSTGNARLTSRPQRFGQYILNSGAVWLALMAYWVATDLVIARFPPGGRTVRPDSWLTHLLFTLAGLAAIWCMHRTGFPAAWDSRIPARRRLLIPALLGIGFGILAILSEEITGATRTLEARLGESFTVGFPGSLLVYSSGSIYWEAFFLMVPVPVLLWLISSVALKGRGKERTFWVLAAISSAIEPAMQGGALLVAADGAISPWTFAAYVLHAYAFNLAAAACFRRYGLLAPVLVRLSYYLVWHILYGNFLA